MQKKRAEITAVGHWVPDKILSNADLEKMVNTTDEWIRTRTGIRERRILEHGATSDMGAKAAQEVLKNAESARKKSILSLSATITPTCSSLPRHALSNKRSAQRMRGDSMFPQACSGFLFSLITAAQFVETGAYKKYSSSAETNECDYRLHGPE